MCMERRSSLRLPTKPCLKFLKDEISNVTSSYTMSSQQPAVTAILCHTLSEIDKYICITDHHQ